ncbi:hypothetical protein Tco_0560944 [Tanacetum coccineum]
MEIEPDIENVTLNKYLKYKAEKERRLRRNVRSKRSPTKYEEADFDSFHQDKSSTFSYPYYHGLPPLHPFNQSAQPYTEDGLVFEEDYNNWVRMGVKNLRKQEEAKVDDCDEGNMDDIWDITVEDVERIRKLLTPSVHTFPEPKPVVQPCVPLLPSLDEVKVVRDEEPNNDVNSISIHVPNVMDDVIQPLIPQVIHTTPLDKGYVAPTTKSIFDELLQGFRNKILNITVVDKEADCNHTKNIEELERLLAKDPQSYLTEIQVYLLSIKTNEECEPFVHTQPLSPLYRAFKSSKLSTKPYKVEREMTSPPWILQQGDECSRSPCLVVSESLLLQTATTT